MLLKLCTKCQIEKPIDDFAIKTRAKDGRQTWCRACYRIRDHQDWKVNTVRRANNAARKTVARDALRIKIFEYLMDHPCVDCGEDDPVVLEFDHRDASLKTANIGDLARGRASFETIMKEIEKCDVRCANCHRRRTALQMKWYPGLI